MQHALVFYDDSKSYSKTKLKTSLEKYINWRLDCMQQQVRLPNFPEHISENIVKYMIMLYSPGSDVCWAKDIDFPGDLYSNKDQKIEVKCFSSDGPITFGPSESWDNIYFLDAKDCVNGNYTCYKIPLTNTSQMFLNLKVNEKETFGQQCKDKRRPRLNWKVFKSQVPMSLINIVFKGHIDRILN